MDEANEDPQPPPPPDEEPQISPFRRLLESVERNETKSCDLGSIVVPGQDAERLTISQVKDLADALTRSTSVTSFTFQLELCALPATGLLVNYIRTSPLLKEVSTEYDERRFRDSQEIGGRYYRQVDHVLDSVRNNPSIQELTATSLGSPRAIYDVLANSTSLKSFNCSVFSISAEMALSIGSGLSKNPSIKNVDLRMGEGPMETIITGIAASAVESLSISPEAEDPPWDALTKMLHFSSTVKDLKITDLTDKSVPGGFFSGLRHPACCDLKTLHLEYVTLDDADDAVVPIDQANASLSVLWLARASFRTQRAVNMLCNLVGLIELTIEEPFPDEDEDADDAENWARFIRRNTKLSEINLFNIVGEGSSYHLSLIGALEGARNHPSLTKMTIDSDYLEIDRDVEVRLCRVLEETPLLTELNLEDIIFLQSPGTLLAQGLRHAHTLQVLHFIRCQMDAHAVREILEALLVNKTLRNLSFLKMYTAGPFPDNFYQTISRVLSENKSLSKLVLSRVDFRAGRLAESLIGLRRNKSLKALIFDQCPIDNEAMTALAQALESTTSAEIALAEIGLPKNTPACHLNGIEEGSRLLLENLVSLNIQKVHFGDALTELESTETLPLLLEAAKKNKKLVVLDGCAPFMDRASSDMAEILYYLKLNRFGRRLLDSPNLPPSLWPRILTRMAGNQEDTDALFYFVREYFSRQNKQGDDEPNEQQQSAQQSSQQPHPPPQKKARIT